MSNELRDYAVIHNAISILAITCAGNEDRIIDMLTGYLWDEEEAGGIKRIKSNKDFIDACFDRARKNAETEK